VSIYDDVKKAIQDLLVPELKSLSVRIDSLDKEMKAELRAATQMSEIHFKRVDDRFDDLIERLDLKRRIESLEREREDKNAS
jgi:hypothetical protein